MKFRRIESPNVMRKAGWAFVDAKWNVIAVIMNIGLAILAWFLFRRGYVSLGVTVSILGVIAAFIMSIISTINVYHIRKASMTMEQRLPGSIRNYLYLFASIFLIIYLGFMILNEGFRY